MTDLRKAAEMALEVLTLINQDIEKHRATLPIRRQPELCKASLALRQALAQPVQVLTAKVVVTGIEHESWCDSVTKLLLSMPPQIPPCNCKLKNEQGNSRPNYPISESNTPLDKIVELAIQGHASTRDAIRWAMQQEREACAKLVEADGLARGDEGLVLIKAAGRIRARSEKRPVKSYCGGKPNYCTPEVTPDVDTVNTSQAIVEYDRQGNIARLFGPIEPDGTLLYAAPPKREWVGLTDDEIGAWPVWSPEIDAFVRNIEAKLKEKNT